LKNLFSLFVSIIIISTSVNLFSLTTNKIGNPPESPFNKGGNSRTISDCLRQIDNKDKEGRHLYYSDKIYIKLKKDAKAFLKTSDELQGTVNYRFGISSIDEKLLKYGVKTNKTFKQRKELLQKNKDHIQSTKQELPDLSRIYTLVLSGVTPDRDGWNKIRKVLKEFADDPNIEYAEPVPIRYLLEIPNDSLYSRQQHLPQIKADSAWDVFKGEDGTKEIIIGISDTGVEWDHPDLMRNLKQNLGEDADGDGHVIEYSENDSAWVLDPGDTNHIDDDGNGYVDDFIGWDFLTDWTSKGEGNDPWDYNSHGTHVSGIAAGVTNNDSGIASISYNVKFLPTSHSSQSYNNIYKGYEGIVYLAENGADVINCSWGGGGYSAAEAESIAYATGLGAILVIAAGNDNSDEHFYPAYYPNVISVASVGVNDRKANYSNYGIGVDIAAPGGDYGNGGGILSTLLNHSYGSYQGTSMASPVAAGCMGFLKAFHPDWSIAQLETQFFGTADNIDSMNANYINKLGAGRVNPYRSLIETNPSIPKKLRLELYRVVTNDSLSDNDGALEPGDTVNIGFVIRNYTHLLTSNSVNFTLESLDPDIEVIKNSYTGSVNPDGYSEIPPVFEVKISESAEARFAKLRLKTASDNEEIVYGSSMDFEIPISTGGVLVWEGIPMRGFSGSFIRDFLKEQGVKVTYGNVFPTTLFGYDAVFLSFGSIGSTETGASMGLTSFDDWMADVVKNYLLDGGKVYIEGTEIFGWDQRNNSELLGLFGIKSGDDGENYVILDTLEGNSSALTINMEFIGSHASMFRSIDTVIPDDNGYSSFYQPGYGTVSVQNIGFYNQKTFYSAYPIAELNDHAQPSTRYELVSRIMNFLGIPIDYTVPYFTAQPITGHAPMEISFQDKSLTTKPIDSWYWDFGDNSGNSNEKNPDWTYVNPGTYDAKMTITRNIKNYDTTKSVYIFDGESALDFNGSSGYAQVQPNTPINFFNKLTIEAWIKPRSGGRGYFGRIADKTNFMFYIAGDRSIRFTFTNDSNKTSNVFTDRFKLNFNVWQHVAVTYDGDSIVKFYVNGKNINDTLFITQNQPRGLIKRTTNNLLIFGNNSNYNRPFDGAIDEIRMWSVERTQQELIKNMNTILNGDEFGLAGYWRFQEGKGSETEDETQYNDIASVYSDWRQGWHSGYIKSQPVSQLLCQGQDASFSINAVGGEKSLTYKWYKDEQPLTGDSRVVGVDSTTLVVNNIIKSDEGNYFVVITAIPGNIKTSSDTVELKAKVNVTLQREEPLREIKVDDRGEMLLSVDATGEAPIFYKWYKNDVLIPGADNSSFRKFPFIKQDEGRYYCMVSNQCNNVVSDTFNVKLNAVSIDTQPLEQSVCEEQDATFTILVYDAGKTLSYQWYKDNQLLVNGSRISGIDSSTLRINNTIEQDEGNYYAQIIANPGNIQLNTNSAFLTIKDSASVQKSDSIRKVRVKEGDDLLLTVEASGEAPLSYKWYKDDVEIPGTDSSTYFKSPFAKEDAGLYYCIVSNECNSAISDTFDVILRYTSVDDYTTDELIKVYPNPFNGITTFYLSLQIPHSVRLVINDILGNEVSEITNQKLEAGLHRYNFNAEGLSSGIYFYSLNIEGKKITGLLNLIK